MLSDRISRLFSLLQCSNTDIARFAGCSPSNISRMKSGSREPPPQSRSIVLLARGVYGYADYENLLSVLCELCGTEDGREEVLVPAIIAWLYETEDFTLPRPVVPRSKRARGRMRRRFGERLDRAMTALEMTNAQLAAALNIDASLVSRYRAGTHAPEGNQALLERLAGVLLARARKQERLGALAGLCGLTEGELDPEALLEWLCDSAEESEPSALARMVLSSINAYAPGQVTPVPARERPAVQAEARYWGSEGLRSAVIRFLTDAAAEGGELCLYSDEPMDWLSGDPAFFAVWASLMAACVQNGVRMRIIHDFERGPRELADAIRGWLPLYVSGMIEPYFFRKSRTARFCHTLFLRPGRACILGMSQAGVGENRWYDYFTQEDGRCLRAVRENYEAMLSRAAPLLRTYPASRAGEFRRFCAARPGRRGLLLSGLSAVTMPEKLLRRMLARAVPEAGRREEVLRLYRGLRGELFETLQNGGVDELVCLPDGAAVPEGVRVNFDPELLDLPVVYTPEEYREHIAAVAGLVTGEKNYHLTLLPRAPFPDIQIFTMEDAAAVLRGREPRTAFVFTNPLLTRSVSDYFLSLREKYASDRRTTVLRLEALGRAADG